MEKLIISIWFLMVVIFSILMERQWKLIWLKNLNQSMVVTNMLNKELLCIA
jgi:hypothetical protein